MKEKNQHSKQPIIKKGQHKSVWVFTIALFLIFIFLLIFSESLNINKTYILIMFLVSMFTVLIYIIKEMVITGSVRAKGAKKRRKKMLPIFFKKPTKLIKAKNDK
jgi:uncharacterized integral membrane protein